MDVHSVFSASAAELMTHPSCLALPRGPYRQLQYRSQSMSTPDILVSTGCLVTLQTRIHFLYVCPTLQAGRRATAICQYSKFVPHLSHGNVQLAVTMHTSCALQPHNTIQHPQALKTVTPMDPRSAMSQLHMHDLPAWH